MKNRNNDSGFTLIELLIVINVLALLALLSMPALQAAIESARRVRCAANLQQLGVSWNSYVSTNECGPPAIVWDGKGVEIINGRWIFPGTADLAELTGRDQDDRIRGGAFLSLLGFGEDLTLILRCPSDPDSAEYRRQTDKSERLARSNYAFNFGPDPPCLKLGAKGASSQELPDWSCSTLFPHAPLGAGVEVFPSEVTEIRVVSGSGVCGINRCFAPRDFVRGMGNVVILDEIRAGRSQSDRRGCWAQPLVGASITYGHGYLGPGGGGPNNCVFDDVVQACHQDYGGCMPCRDDIGLSVRATSRSSHAGGVNQLFADGSVRFVVDDIDRMIWTDLHSRF